MLVSIVIPVFRAELTLERLHDDLVKVLETDNVSFEIIFVEDSGGDRSWEIIEKIVENDKRVTGIRFAKNYGQHNALLCGIRAAEGEVIVTMDDDLQNPPGEIPKLLAGIDDGYDVVYGTPLTEQHGLVRDFASQITKVTLQKSMGAETASKVSAFRAFRTSLRKSFENYQSPTVNIDVLLTWGTSSFTSIDVVHDQRVLGESGYTMRKLVNHAFNMMTGFSTLPLKLASLLGFIFSGIGMLVLLYILVRYLIEGSNVPGFPFIASIVAIFSGVQLFTLGIIGEYLARMHFRTMDKPAYSVKSMLKSGK